MGSCAYAQNVKQARKVGRWGFRNYKLFYGKYLNFSAPRKSVEMLLKKNPCPIFQPFFHRKSYNQMKGCSSQMTEALRFPMKIVLENRTRGSITISPLFLGVEQF